MHTHTHTHTHTRMHARMHAHRHAHKHAHTHTVTVSVYIYTLQASANSIWVCGLSSGWRESAKVSDLEHLDCLNSQYTVICAERPVHWHTSAASSQRKLICEPWVQLIKLRHFAAFIIINHYSVWELNKCYAQTFCPISITKNLTYFIFNL